LHWFFTSTHRLANLPSINKTTLARILRKWHRRTSLTLLLWLLFVAITGIALNHATDFGFDSRPLPANLMSSVYGVEPPDTTSFYIAGAWLSHVTGNQLFWEKEPVGYCEGLVGVAAYQGEVYAACRETLYILGTEGQLIERINAGLGIGFPIERFGLCEGLPCTAGADGNSVLNPQQFAWQPTRSTLSPSVAAETPAGLASALKRINSPPDFRVQRLIRDLHSGAFFGLGPWLMDIFAVGLIGVALMGLGLWWSNRR
jgi:hypothetical protein